MYHLSLAGTPTERGFAQGRAYGHLMREELARCPVWLGGMAPERIAAVRDTMVRALDDLCPEMVEELRGLAAGSGLGFEEVCVLNFVSAIGALHGCSNLVACAPAGERGPILAKTSDIGDDYRYYSLQEVEPSQGYPYLAVSWVGCLWAEVGVNAAGLACGQGSAPTMPGQVGYGIPTLEYPRVLLERCADVDEAVQFCFDTPMAGKGLNIALVDALGGAAIVEKSGTKAAVRRLLAGATSGGLYCANHFLDPAMEPMIPLSIPGLPELSENSQVRLGHAANFLAHHPRPSRQSLLSLLTTALEEGGLCQQLYPELTTHYIYLVRPEAREMVVGSRELSLPSAPQAASGAFTLETHRLALPEGGWGGAGLPPREEADR